MSTDNPPKPCIDFAIDRSLQSPCRSKRGAVIFTGSTSWGYGFNHKPEGFDCDGSDDCKATCRIDAIHAEQQALIFCTDTFERDMLHVKTVDGKLVPSGPPSCVECSKLILAAGIRYMWLFHTDGWRKYDAVEFHRLSLQHSTQRRSA